MQECNRRWNLLAGPFHSLQPPIALTAITAALLIYCLPLALTSHNSEYPLLLAFSPLNSTSPTALLIYLLLPCVILLYLLQRAGIKYLRHLELQQKYNYLSPERYACLATLPSDQLGQEWLTSQIHEWWNDQVAKHPERTAALLNLQSDCAELLSTPKQTALVDKLIWSYDCQQLVGFGRQLGREGELSWLRELGPHQRNRFLRPTQLRYCLIIFTSIALSQYFLSTHSIEHRGTKLEVERRVLPNEVLWNRMFLQRGPTTGWMMVVGAVAMGAGIWYGFYWWHRNLLQNSSQWASSLPWVIGLAINMYIFIWNLIFQKWADSEQTTSWGQHHRRCLYRNCLASILLLAVLPYICYSLAASWMFRIQAGATQTLLSTALLYMAITLLQPLVSKSILGYFLGCVQQAPRAALSEQLSQAIVVFYLLAILLPLEPMLGLVAVLWALLTLLREYLFNKYTYSAGPPHGLQLIYSAKPLLAFAPLLLVTSACLTRNILSQENRLLTAGQGAVLGLVATVVLLGPFLPQWTCWHPQNDQEQTYLERVSKFEMLYQEGNPVNLMPVRVPIGVKIEEEMQTMSKTLTLSLKERLLNMQGSLLDPLSQEVEEDGVNDIYFTYEQKVFMKSSESKVTVPPLFPKAVTTHREEPEELGNLKWLDKQGRKQLKHHLQTGIKQFRTQEQ